MKIHYKIVILILVVVGTFYWFQVRPAQIKKECAHYAQKLACDENDGGCEKERYDFRFKKCLSEYGL